MGGSENWGRDYFCIKKVAFVGKREKFAAERWNVKPPGRRPSPRRRTQDGKTTGSRPPGVHGAKAIRIQKRLGYSVLGRSISNSTFPVASQPDSISIQLSVRPFDEAFRRGPLAILRNFYFAFQISFGSFGGFVVSHGPKEGVGAGKDMPAHWEEAAIKFTYLFYLSTFRAR